MFRHQKRKDIRNWSSINTEFSLPFTFLTCSYNRWNTACGESRKYMSELNQNAQNEGNNCLMAWLCFHRFAHFDFVPTYTFVFNHKQCASDKEDFTFVKFNSQLFSNADESLKDKTRLLLLWDGSIVTLRTLCSYIYHLWWSQCTSLWPGTEFLQAV